MSAPPAKHSALAELSIWFFAFGYFASYAPYAALTKAMTKGLLEGMDRPISGTALLPSSVMASTVGMFAFLTIMGWWKHAGRRKFFGVELPSPNLWTFLSGLCTASIIMTTTLAYTFRDVSIVLVMLLMRGGVLVIAPVVDLISKRKVRWFSFAALGLSIAALLVAITGDAGSKISIVCALNVVLYLLSYFVRLQFMSRFAKSSAQNANVRFFVEEQMVATPASLILLLVLTWVGPETVQPDLQQGFTTFWSSPVIGYALLIGLFSQGTGIFGGLILLDKRENTYCVPVNRASSILAGVVASYGLALFMNQRTPGSGELLGAGLIVAAILFLTLPVLVEKKLKARRDTAPQ